MNMKVLILALFHFVKPRIYINFLEVTKLLSKIGIILPMPDFGVPVSKIRLLRK